MRNAVIVIILPKDGVNGIYLNTLKETTREIQEAKGKTMIEVNMSSYALVVICVVLFSVLCLVGVLVDYLVELIGGK